MKTIAILGAAALTLSAGAAQATQLYGADFGPPGVFYGIDTATGVASPVGPMGNTDVGDLTSDTRAGGPIWGIDLSANELLTFDAATAGITSVVPITGSRAPITSIAFDPVTGVLYGNDTLAFGGGAGELYTIDPFTGAAASVGATGFDNIFALGFDQSGRLFGIDETTDEFLSISTATGMATSIGATGLGFSFDIASDPITGIMYLVDTGAATLFTVDTGTAAVTAVGGWGPDAVNIAGLAFAPIPIPGALPLMLAGLGALGYLKRRAG